MAARDIPDGLRLCRASSWNQLAEDWRVFLESPGSGSLLMERDGRVLGTAAFLRYDTLAWVAMMLVEPAERGAGLGAQLLAGVLSELDGAACVGLDATPAGEPLYRRFGFVKTYGLIRTKAIVDAACLPSPEGMARRMVESDLTEVFRLDREIFGADRGRLLAGLFARAPECAWVAPGGYVFGRPGYRYGQIGPIVAADVGIARELAICNLSQQHGQEVAIDVPGLDEGWIEFLRSVGFVEERRFVRMFLRGGQPGMPERQYAICGPEFG
jgi:GNAT superfamily N-acetyltransferase